MSKKPAAHLAYTVKVAADGTKRVTGKKKQLQHSQLYPVRFALAVVRSHWACSGGSVGHLAWSVPEMWSPYGVVWGRDCWR